jgi:Flp pilus assembly protein TadB
LLCLKAQRTKTMTKVRLGDGYDKSHTNLKLTTMGESKLHVRGGDLHQQASADVTIEDRGYSPSSPDSNDMKPRRPSPPHALWSGIARAVMILVSLVVILTALAVVSSKVTAWALPLVVAAALIGTYLLALVVMPAHERNDLKGFTPVLSAFVQEALRPGSRPKE